jgi:hypothetical protein
MKMVTQTVAYIVIGTRVVNSVAKEGEFVPDVALKGDTEVELSRAEPTLGSSLVFCQERQLSSAQLSSAGGVPRLRVLGKEPIKIW